MGAGRAGPWLPRGGGGGGGGVVEQEVATTPQLAKGWVLAR